MNTRPTNIRKAGELARALPRTLLGAGIALTLLASSASAQLAIFSNASNNATLPALGVSNITSSGVAAPSGATWSEVSALSATESNALAGLSGQSLLSGAYRFADDFVIGANHTWQLSSISLYAYQPSALGTSSPFSGVNLQIWSGRPGDVGSTVVWGDTTTNRLTSSSSTGTYRVFNTLVAPGTTPDQSRLIWKLNVAAPVTLQPGTYWLDWQITSIDPLAEAFSPTATVAGQRTLAGWNARQFKPAAPPAIGGVWVSALDPGKPSSASDVGLALPFIVTGVVTGCVADFDLSGTANIDDIFIYLNAWFAGDPRCNVDNANGVNIDDIFIFLNIWFTGCP